MKIKLKNLQPWHKNEKLHPCSPKRLEELKKSLIQHGQILSLLIDGRDNITILGGNHQYLAMIELGWTEAEAIFKTPKDDKEALILGLKHNSHYAEYNIKELREEIININIEDLQDIHLGLNEINLLDEETEEDEFDENEEYINKIVKFGDIYELGNHRLMCGDSSNINDVNKLLNKEKIKTLFTSPPYNMAQNLYKNYKDNLKRKEFIQFNINIINIWKKHIIGYLFWNINYNRNSRSEFIEILYRIIKEMKMRFLELIIWDKGHAIPINSSDMLTRQYENILLMGQEEQIINDLEFIYLGTKFRKANLFKNSYTGFTNYWKINSNKIQIKDNLACFPVELPGRGIIMTTKEKDIIADPFGGSGTTLIACEQLNRRCRMMEIDPHYCDIIIARWQKWTGKKTKKIN